MQAVTIEIELAEGIFNTETAEEVGERLGQVLGGQPFMVFSKTSPLSGAKVMRLVGGAAGVTVHRDDGKSCLLLKTTRGDVELAFGISPHYRKITYRFTPGDNLLIEDGARSDAVAVVMPLRPPNLQAGAGPTLVVNREYALHSGNIRDVAEQLHRWLTGHLVVFASPDTLQGLDRYRFPLVKAVWVGEGVDNRLIIEIEGQDEEGADFTDQVFLLGRPGKPNALGERLAVTFFSDRNITFWVRQKNLPQRTCNYWPLPNFFGRTLAAS